MNNNIATDLSLVTSKINATASSRSQMVSGLKKLQNSLNSATSWQGVDADAHKAALNDFCEKLISCAAWMEAAGQQAIEHSTKLHDRAVEDQKTASIFYS